VSLLIDSLVSDTEYQTVHLERHIWRDDFEG